MKKYQHIIIFSVLLLMAATLQAGERLAVIVNSENTQIISLEDVHNIYMDKVIAWKNGEKISVYNLPVSSTVRANFSWKTLGMSSRDAAAAESNRSMTNTRRNPQRTKRERLLAFIVSRNPNAIGYMKAASAKARSGVRILFILD